MYFIAVVPPPPLRDQLMQLKVEFSEAYHTKAALHSPPHITLLPPFHKPLREEPGMRQALEEFGLRYAGPTFNIDLEGYGCFRPRVIFIQVRGNDSLMKWQEKLAKFCTELLGLTEPDDRPYHPHLTLAFRDLKRDAFDRAWAEVRTRSFQSSFPVDRFALLKHDRQCWQILEEFLLASTTPGDHATGGSG
jgi:2'-5' RNA ligase